MNGLDYFTAGWLGVLQGFTEFLPISSSGHLAIVQRWLELDPDSLAHLVLAMEELLLDSHTQTIHCFAFGRLQD